MPTWWLPTGNTNKGTIVTGIINPGRLSSFGKEVGNLKKYGNTFPDGSSTFNNQDTFETQMVKKWGEYSGTFGRELGPGNFNDIYSNKYFRAPGGNHPSGDYISTLASNRNCNLVNNNKYTYMDPGLITDSNYKEISNFRNTKR